jgi:hypothetical protein
LKDDKGVTIEKSNSGFTFVNFNFVVHWCVVEMI